MKRNSLFVILMILVLCGMIVSCAQVPQEKINFPEKQQESAVILPTELPINTPEPKLPEESLAAEEAEPAVPILTYPPKMGEYIVMECTGFQSSTHETPATAEYPLWSYENMSETAQVEAEKNVSVEFLGDQIDGKYKEMSQYIKYNNYRIHEYENEQGYELGLHEGTGEIANIWMPLGNETYLEIVAGKSDAEIAELIADGYIDRSEFEINKEEGYEGELCYNYTREICGVKTCESLSIGIRNGGISSFSVNMIDEFAQALAGKSDEAIQQEIGEMTSEEAVQKLDAEINHIFGEFEYFYEIVDKRLVVTDDGELGVIYRVTVKSDEFFGDCSTGFLIRKW